MGWIKDAKANLLLTQASHAFQEGRTVFAPMLNTPADSIGNVGVDRWVGRDD